MMSEFVTHPIDVNASPLREQLPRSCQEESIGFPGRSDTWSQHPFMDEHMGSHVTPGYHGFQVAGADGEEWWEMPDPDIEGAKFILTGLDETGAPSRSNEGWMLTYLRDDADYSGPVWVLTVQPDGTGTVEVRPDDTADDPVVILRGTLQRLCEDVDEFLNHAGTATAEGYNLMVDQLRPKVAEARETADSFTGWE